MAPSQGARQAAKAQAGPEHREAKGVERKSEGQGTIPWGDQKGHMATQTWGEVTPGAHVGSQNQGPSTAP